MDILPFASAGRNAAGSAPPARAPLPGSPLDKPLIEAVQVHGMRTRGLPANLVTVQYADGSAVTIPVPIEPATLAPPFWPRPEGWDFRPGLAAFNGVAFRLTGKCMTALRLLAQRPGWPIRVEQLFRDVWLESADRTDPSAVQVLLSSLRRSMRAALGIPKGEDPIPFIDGAYTLMLGAVNHDTEGRAA